MKELCGEGAASLIMWAVMVVMKLGGD